MNFGSTPFARSLSFAGEDVSLVPYSLKLSVRITNWPFASTRNRLALGSKSEVYLPPPLLSPPLPFALPSSFSSHPSPPLCSPFFILLSSLLFSPSLRSPQQTSTMSLRVRLALSFPTSTILLVRLHPQKRKKKREEKKREEKRRKEKKREEKKEKNKKNAMLK